MAFPEHLAPQIAPEGFAKGLDTVKAACPDVLGDAKADCDEFPCRILLSGPQATGRWDENRCVCGARANHGAPGNCGMPCE